MQFPKVTSTLTHPVSVTGVLCNRALRHILTFVLLTRTVSDLVVAVRFFETILGSRATCFASQVVRDQKETRALEKRMN